LNNLAKLLGRLRRCEQELDGRLPFFGAVLYWEGVSLISPSVMLAKRHPARWNMDSGGRFRFRVCFPVFTAEYSGADLFKFGMRNAE
jgi:hypothetical protein